MDLIKKSALMSMFLVFSMILSGCISQKDSVTNYSRLKDKAKWSDYYLEVLYCDDSFTFVRESSPYTGGGYSIRFYESTNYPGYLTAVYINDEKESIADNYILSVKRKDAALYVKDALHTVIPNCKVYLTNGAEPVSLNLDVNIPPILNCYNITILTPQIVSDRQDFEKEVASSFRAANIRHLSSLTVFEGVPTDISLDNENEILSFFNSHKSDFTTKFNCSIKDGEIDYSEWLDN